MQKEYDISSYQTVRWNTSNHL